MTLYDELWRDFRPSLGLSVKGQRNPKDALTQWMRFRQKASLLRLDGCVTLVEDLLENGMKVAVSVAFQETLESLRERLFSLAPVCAIHGRLAPAEKEAERRRFQGGDARVCLFAVEEGKGYLLHFGPSGYILRVAANAKRQGPTIEQVVHARL